MGIPMKEQRLKKVVSREFLVYMVFGILTTVVNWGVYHVMLELMGGSMVLIVNAIAFVAAVSVAFLTNKPFVFQSHDWHWKVVSRELFTFVGSRILTFALEEVGLFLCQRVFRMDTWELLDLNGLVYAKLALSLLIVLLNYAISKWLVFRKSAEDQNP